jgi:hypothetical protein
MGLHTHAHDSSDYALRVNRLDTYKLYDDTILTHLREYTPNITITTIVARTTIRRRKKVQ